MDKSITAVAPSRCSRFRSGLSTGRAKVLTLYINSRSVASPRAVMLTYVFSVVMDPYPLNVVDALTMVISARETFLTVPVTAREAALCV